MTTENRSSNTEMAAKLCPCPFCGQQDAFVEQLDSDASVVICQGRVDKYSACLARGPVGVRQHEGEDQPGHDQAVKEWNKRAAPQPHPEPIAWMVGTAFWWTKDEAERDAEATGIPIVGLGPMPDAGEAARLRIELGHMRDERDDLSAKLDRFYSRTHGIKNLAAIEELSDKLADRDALLTDISKRHWSGVDFDLPADLVDRIKALFASAEPNAPGVLPRAHDVNMFQRTAEPGAKS
ncbi:Lar family restriction alleviation protein [Pseudomonas asiatica]|uniref:Lar family restriction alleviation protein n=1 Tax=Pseudomonas asiatica TaxID=2219225 RepID=A0A9X4DC61_9PSED|nr:Lar family restriction alleviation protein [Pseudomonas asiatica]MDD2113777.1 Lar family restriction alleviation protein [Pseudomonas asiatica]